MRSSRESFVDDAVLLLVRHFGLEQVRGAVVRISSESKGALRPVRTARGTREKKAPRRETVDSSLASISLGDPEKFRLLSGFYTQLKERQILPETQDIRHFAQMVGLKEISGKARKDFVTQLMRFLVDQPVARLRVDTQRALGISEQQRRQGFSVLADKLLGKK